ncbi:hypothetical protein LV779_36050 [Streptomyces thinghirensis]|nr:hypothetical protein [Streptomyces thinghirensis]
MAGLDRLGRPAWRPPRRVRTGRRTWRGGDLRLHVGQPLKLAAAALDAALGRGTVLMDAEDFPTNRYIVQGLAEQRGLRLVRLPSELDGGLDLDAARGTER